MTTHPHTAAPGGQTMLDYPDAEIVLARLWRGERIQAMNRKREEQIKADPRAKMQMAILDLMADGRERTVDDVRARLDFSRERVRSGMARLAHEGFLSVEEVQLDGSGPCPKIYRRAVK